MNFCIRCPWCCTWCGGTVRDDRSIDDIDPSDDNSLQLSATLGRRPVDNRSVRRSIRIPAIVLTECHRMLGLRQAGRRGQHVGFRTSSSHSRQCWDWNQLILFGNRLHLVTSPINIARTSSLWSSFVKIRLSTIFMILLVGGGTASYKQSSNENNRRHVVSVYIVAFQGAFLEIGIGFWRTYFLMPKQR